MFYFIGQLLDFLRDLIKWIVKLILAPITNLKNLAIAFISTIAILVICFLLNKIPEFNNITTIKPICFIIGLGVAAIIEFFTKDSYETWAIDGILGTAFLLFFTPIILQYVSADTAIYIYSSKILSYFVYILPYVLIAALYSHILKGCPFTKLHIYFKPRPKDE